jgi:alkyl hydroperoxide reductase subunit D
VSELGTLLASLPDTAKDLRLNATALLERSSLPRETALTVALACARSLRHRPLLGALLAEAADLPAERRQAADVAAGLMGMNNVWYRYKALAGTEEAEKAPAGLRMSAIARPGIPKPEFDLVSLAVSALGGCGSCVKSHEHAAREGGFRSEQVYDAVRLAAVLAGLAAMLPE